MHAQPRFWYPQCLMAIMGENIRASIEQRQELLDSDSGSGLLEQVTNRFEAGFSHDQPTAGPATT